MKYQSESDLAAAPCRDPQYSPDDWFLDGNPSDKIVRNPKVFEVKQRCFQQCPVYQACQEMALREGITHGIFGGLTGRDRRHIWKLETEHYPMGRPRHHERVMDKLTNTIKREAS